MTSSTFQIYYLGIEGTNDDAALYWAQSLSLARHSEMRMHPLNCSLKTKRVAIYILRVQTTLNSSFGCSEHCILACTYSRSVFISEEHIGRLSFGQRQPGVNALHTPFCIISLIETLLG